MTEAGEREMFSPNGKLYENRHTKRTADLHLFDFSRFLSVRLSSVGPLSRFYSL